MAHCRDGTPQRLHKPQQQRERWQAHCVDGLSMRAIARHQGVHASTVMRAVHGYEARMDDDGPKMTRRRRPRPRDFVAGMPIVQRAWDRGLLTERQLLAAVWVHANPDAVPLPPRLHAILRRLIDGKSVEEVELKANWSARSGRVMLAVLLDTVADARSGPVE